MDPNVTNVVELGTQLVSALGDQDMFIEGKTHISKKGRIVIGGMWVYVKHQLF